MGKKIFLLSKEVCQMNYLHKISCLGLALVCATTALYAGGDDLPKGPIDPTEDISFTSKYIVGPIKNNQVTAGIIAAALAGTVAYKTVPKVKETVDKTASWVKARGQEGCAVVNKKVVKPVQKLLKKLDKQKLSRADALALILAGAAGLGVYKDVFGVRTRSTAALTACKNWVLERTTPAYEIVKEWVMRDRTNQIIAGTVGAGALAGSAYLGYKLYKAHQEKANKEKAEQAA
jgi:hypothetical protein